ncbi:hypothetical protein LTS18_005919 [Coniosporium uncinatum]|uniref:Uncharacterized protein n=1 Tax=Coniosporium uncinatum TaxID=93489 RepID=A0ACC3DQZ8_9PEZI|nr:hypothetical protein LTS18_005919 [Coniosporium uncinatum]
MDLLTWTFSIPDSVPEIDLDKPLLVDAINPDRTLSFHQLRIHVCRLIAGLVTAGIQPGECVAVSAFNDIYYAVLYLAIIGCGAVFLGLNPSYTVPELRRIYELARPRVVFVEPESANVVLAAVRGMKGLHGAKISRSAMYVFDPRGATLSAASAAAAAATTAVSLGLPSWTSLLEHGELEWVTVQDPLRTVAQYATTSGTSGLPKIALLTHGYHVSQARILFDLRTASAVIDERGGENGARGGAGLTALPPFHVFATPILPSSVRANRTLYVFARYPGREGYLEAVERFGVGETWVPPSVLVDLASFASGPSCPPPPPPPSRPPSPPLSSAPPSPSSSSPKLGTHNAETETRANDGARAQMVRRRRDQLATLRDIYFGGADVAPKDRKRLRGLMRHPAAKVRAVYGMTEAGWISCSAAPPRAAPSCNSAESLDEEEEGSAGDEEDGRGEDGGAGELLMGFEGKVVSAEYEDFDDGNDDNNDDDDDRDDDDDDDDNNAQGELYVKSAALFLGYLDNETSTAAAFDAHGFLRTGDIASLDKDGRQVRMCIHGRRKEMIKVRGWQVAPREVEAVLREFEGVRDAVVVGLRGGADGKEGFGREGGEERVGAVLVVREGGGGYDGGGDGGGVGSEFESPSASGFVGKRIDLVALREFLGARLARYKIPSEIAVVERLPRDGMGKVRRAELLGLFRRVVGGAGE